MPEGTVLRLSKNPSGFSDKLLQSAARTPCAPEAHNSHTRSLSCIFCQVHAPAENDPTLFAASGSKLCEAFFDKLKTVPEGTVLSFLLSSAGADDGDQDSRKDKGSCRSHKKHDIQHLHFSSSAAP